MQGVAGWIAVCEDEGLRALALGPSACERGRVPVDFVEEVRDVREAFGTVAVGGPVHVVLVVFDAG